MSERKPHPFPNQAPTLPQSPETTHPVHLCSSCFFPKKDNRINGMNTDSAPISVGLGSHPFGGQKDDPHRAVHGGPLYARRRVMPMLLAVVQDAPQAGLAFTYRSRLLAKNPTSFAQVFVAFASLSCWSCFGVCQFLLRLWKSAGKGPVAGAFRVHLWFQLMRAPLRCRLGSGGRFRAMGPVRGRGGNAASPR